MVRGTPALAKGLGAALIALAALLLLAPLLVVVGVSVSESQFIAFPPEGLSLRWYLAILASPAYLSAAWVSLKLAAAVTLLATVLGGAAAIAIHRRSVPGSAALSALFLSPLVLPSIIFAIGMLMFWSGLFGPVSFATLLVAHTAIALPYVIRTTLAVLADLDPFLEEAARTMGAGRLQRLVHVVLPQCRPGLAAGAFLAFNISFDEAVLSLFLRSPTLSTLPVQIYNQLEFSPDPTVAAVSVVMIAATILTMALIHQVLGLSRVVQ